jgi:hypothetical protein
MRTTGQPFCSKPHTSGLGGDPTNEADRIGGTHRFWWSRRCSLLNSGFVDVYRKIRGAVRQIGRPHPPKDGFNATLCDHLMEVIGMAQSTRKQTANRVSTAADRSSESYANRSAHVKESDIARCAYDLYLARGCEPGHDVDDWLRAERDLRYTGQFHRNVTV